MLEGSAALAASASPRRNRRQSEGQTDGPDRQRRCAQLEPLTPGSRKVRPETVKYLPVMFVWANIAGLYFIFMCLHISPMLQHPHYHWAGKRQM